MSYNLDPRYDQVAAWRANAWKKVEAGEATKVEDTAEWQWSLDLVDEILADQEK